METNTHRKWYSKKRYIIPGIVLGSLIVIGAFSDSSQDLQTQQGQVIEIRNLSEPDSSGLEDSVPVPTTDVEEQAAPTFTPTPTPIITPTPKPSPTPKPTSVQQQKTTSQCDPNYSGCVPIASDVDCAGGSGDGPAYVRGPIYVVGSDIYGLDRDGDGVACQ